MQLTNESSSYHYRILILSSIPVVETEGRFSTIDLWARDLETQCHYATVHLLCPVEAPAAERTPIDSNIVVHNARALSDQDLEKLVSLVDIIQLPGNVSWRDARSARRLLRTSRRLGKKVILGVSSNRAKTAWLNSRNKLIGAIKYSDIRICQSWLAARSDGVFVVGEGLRELFTSSNSNIHVGIASWIRPDDIALVQRKPTNTLQLCMASRIEKMKGMHIGVAAVALVYKKHANLKLLIIGDGPEKANLRHQVEKANLGLPTTFNSTVPYPQPFLSLLRSQDIVLLTNLNDEQPRLIFDAISQGCLPICPDNKAYRNLGLNEQLLYKQGDAQDLCRAIERLLECRVRKRLQEEMLALAQTFTLDSMHRERSLWIAKLMDG